MNFARPSVISRTVRGPEILLCVRGNAVLTASGGSAEVALCRGAAAFIRGSTGRYEVRGDGASLYRATVNFT